MRDAFAELPPCVSFLITSRPEEHVKRSMATKFEPIEILPEDPRHLGDLRMLITHLLRPRMAAGDLERGVEVLLEKSEGAFVYIAQIMEQLESREQLTLEDLQVRSVKLVFGQTPTPLFRSNVTGSV